MSDTATPTPACTAAAVSPILKGAENTGSEPLISTWVPDGSPWPRTSRTSSRAVAMWPVPVCTCSFAIKNYVDRPERKQGRYTSISMVAGFLDKVLMRPARQVQGDAVIRRRPARSHRRSGDRPGCRDRRGPRAALSALACDPHRCPDRPGSWNRRKTRSPGDVACPARAGDARTPPQATTLQP